MAQHDYNLANQSGADFRADLNNALSAIATNNSGSSQPSTTFAYEWWVDTSSDVLKIRNSADNAWITLPISVTADNTVDINGGTVNGISSLSFSSGATVTTILDEDNLASDSATALATQQSIKAYVDSQVTAQDLDITDGSSSISIDLDSESLGLLGGTGITSTASGNNVTFAIDTTVATLTGSQTLTNKTFDADNNTVTNLEVDNLKSGVLDTDLSSVSGSDDTLASAKAIKTYVDTQITAEDLDISDGSTAISIDLDSETLSLLGGTGVSSTASGNNVTFAIGQAVGTGDNVQFNQVTSALVGNASTATSLQTARTINGTSFDGTANIAFDSDAVTEGSSNLYFTNARSRASISENSTQLSYNSSTGVLTFTQGDTDTVSEGSANLYFTNERVDDRVNDLLVAGSGITLTYNDGSNTLTIAGQVGDITSVVAGDGLTGGGTSGDVTLAVGVDDSSIEINSDALRVKASGITNAMLSGSIANAKLSNSSVTINSQSLSLGATLTLDTDNIGEGSSNLYYTDARSNSAIDARVTQSFVNALNVNAASVDNNSVALGTKTTGNYVATISGSTNEIEVSGSGSETASVTIGLPDDVTIAGNLTVNGTTTTVNSDTLSVTDPLIKLAKSNSGADSLDIGFYGLYDTSGSQDLYAGLFRDANDSGKFKLFKDLQVEPTTTVNTSGTGYAVGTLVSNLEGNVTGNVTGSADTLTTARAIALSGDVVGTANFDGSASISISTTIQANSVALGTDTTGNFVADLTAGEGIDVSGGGSENATITVSAEDATETNKGIASFDGTDFTVSSGDVTVNVERIQDIVGGMVSGNTETGITVTYQDADGTLDFVVGTLNQDTTGNAATATALETARTIGGVSFDGTGNIDLAGVNTAGNQNTSGNAATATALANARTIGGTSFDGTANIAIALAATSTALATARNIGGVSFDGTADITPTTFADATFSGDVNVDSGLLFVDVSEDKVGIGTSSPTGKLEIAATGTNAAPHIKLVESGDTREFNIYNDGSGNGHLVLADSDDDTSDTEIVLNDNGIITMLTGNSERMRIDSSGNVDIKSSNLYLTGSNDRRIKLSDSGIAGVSDSNNTVHIRGDDDTLILNNAGNGNMLFQENGTERMRISASTGNVGIGTTSPARPLHIENAEGRLVRLSHTSNPKIEFVDTTNGTSGAYLGSEDNELTFETSGQNERMRIDAAGNVGIGITNPQQKLVISDGGGYGFEFAPNLSSVNHILSFDRSADAYRDFKISANQIILGYGQAASNEAMRIDSGGGVAIGTTSPDGVSNLTVKSQNSTAGQEFVSLHHQATSGLVYFISFMTEASGVDRGYITYNNSTNTVGFTQASDEILKENIRDLTGGLDFIKQIKPRVFDWKEESRGKDQVGFIAQEIETIKPEWVGKKEGLKNIPADLTGTVPYLIKAIQEQQELIDALTTRIETLEATE